MAGEILRTMRWMVLAGLAFVAAAAAGGCSYHRTMQVPVMEPAGGWPARAAVDVQNFHGSVTVVVDPTVDRVVPTARAGVRQSVDRGLQWRPAEAVSVVMDVVEQEGGSVVKVRTGSMWHDPDAVWVDLHLRMPSCDGAIVWNRGGPVMLVGVSGAIHVENGPLQGVAEDEEGRSDGRIEVRTDAPMTQPVALVTRRGTVVYQVGAGSTGDFLLRSGDRPVEFYAPAARADQIRGGGRELNVVLNRGANPVLLSSDKGRVRAMVIDEPVAYTNRLR